MNNRANNRGATWLHKKFFWNVLARQALLFVGFYFLFGFVYQSGRGWMKANKK